VSDFFNLPQTVFFDTSHETAEEIEDRRSMALIAQSGDILLLSKS
jgi:hypothetical protein